MTNYWKVKKPIYTNLHPSIPTYKTGDILSELDSKDYVQQRNFDQLVTGGFIEKCDNPFIQLPFTLTKE